MSDASEQKTTWTLVMNSREQFRPKWGDWPTLMVTEVEQDCPAFNWFLHQLVGRDHRWGGREGWGEAEWSAYVTRPELRTWVASLDGTPAGYFELDHQPDEVQIRCFGLTPSFVGLGLGGHFLSVAIETAWQLETPRLSLTTCSHDHAHALPNYLARGFEIENETIGPANDKLATELFGGR